MLLTEKIIIKWERPTRKWYESKGYIFTQYKDKFEINPDDLSNGSQVSVEVQCDECKKIIENVHWKNYKECTIKNHDKYFCNKCAIKLYGDENKRKSRLKNGKSFYDWCYENLSEEEADNIMLRWDYNKNINKNGNVLSPKDISYGSRGFNYKGYWFKCLDHPEHGSELKFINNFTNDHKNSITCNQCNTISITNPGLIRYLVNKEDALKYSEGSDEKILMKCIVCGHEKKIRIPALIKQGFACPKCSDGKSYSEKFMFNLLEQITKIFICQLSKSTYKWCNKYKYDFYINDAKIIIETNGIQHYEKLNNGWQSLEETQENDKAKEQLARENGIKNYIVLDCRLSDMEYIKNSITNSELPTLLNFKEEDINWLKCHEYACNSLVKVVCNLWNNGIKNTIKISKEIRLSDTTIVRYLKQGAKLGWCDYDPKKSQKNKKHLYKKVICLTTKEIFSSLTEGANKYNTYKNNISNCCRNINKSAGKHPNTGEPLKWMYYNEYIQKIYNNVNQSLSEKEVI